MTTEIPFVKMHGLGNDYVYVDGYDVAIEDPPAIARRVSDRRRGIGGDGLIMLVPPSAGGDVGMRMFNADGSEGEMCGNGIRCLARLAVERGRATGPMIEVDTAAGRRIAEIREGEGDGTVASDVAQVRVDMGIVTFGAAAVGLDRDAAAGVGARASSDAGLEGAWRFETAGGRDLDWWPASAGNPHIVAFVDDEPGLESVDLDVEGPPLERHPAFPARINVHFVAVTGTDRLRMRTWERGSGATDACGTGACAVAAVARATGRCGDRVIVRLPGGELTIEMDASGRVHMTGPAERAFEGVYRID